MRDYVSELNTGTIKELRNEILFESHKYNPSIHYMSFKFSPGFLAIILKNGSLRLLPLIDLYNSVENLGIQFNENHIDLWLSLFRDFCVEEIIRMFPTLD